MGLARETSHILLDCHWIAGPCVTVCHTADEESGWRRGSPEDPLDLPW